MAFRHCSSVQTDIHGRLFSVGSVNAAPSIDLSNSTVSGTVLERLSITGVSDLDIATGAIAFTDANQNDRPTASITNQNVTYLDALGDPLTLTPAQLSLFKNALLIVPDAANTNNGKIDWGYTIGDATLDFLGEGETVTVVSTVAIDDQHGGSVNQDVTLTIVGANDLPKGLSDSAIVRKGTTLSADASHGVLANDHDPDLHDQQSLNVSKVNGLSSNVGQLVSGTYGTLTLRTDGSYSYRVNANIGNVSNEVVDHFSYTVNDGHGGEVVSSLDIRVVSWTRPSGLFYLSGAWRRNRDTGLWRRTHPQ